MLLTMSFQSKKSIVFPGAAAFFMVCFLSIQAIAQIGSLDLSFGTNGIAKTSIGTSGAYGQSISIQPDGKIVVAGYSNNGQVDVFSIIRYNANGSLDNTFGTDGKVNTKIGNSNSRAYAQAFQSDGKIVVAGYTSITSSGFDFAIARYNPDGSPDNGFDNDGIVTTDFGDNRNEKAYSIAIQADGKILVAGYNTDLISNQRDFAWVRYQNNGRIDSTFNGNGKVTLSLASGIDEGRALAIQNDGKILLAGYSFNFIKRVFGLVRLKPNGSIDSTFDGDGIVTTGIGQNDDAAYAMAVQADGKIILAGYTSGTSYDIALTRYNNNGSLDNSFDLDGIVTTQIGTSTDIPTSLVLQNDGKILAAGHSFSGTENFALVRYNSNGSLDNSFDSDGLVTTNFSPENSEDIVRAMAIQSDGKIVVAGETSVGSSSQFAAARYNNSGTTDIDFVETRDSPFRIFPNPAGNAFYLETSESFVGSEYKVLDEFGKTVLTGSVHSVRMKIESEGLPKGFYFFSCRNKVWKLMLEKG